MILEKKNYAGMIKHPRGRELGWRNIRGYVVPVSSAFGVGQYFSDLCLKRINQQKPCNIIFTGEAGISKTYTAIAWARFLDPSFSIRNIAFTHTEFMNLMNNLKEKQIIVLDEPEYVAGHREWYKTQNQALVATMRSGRFKVHPLFIPTINKRLLDKVVRENLLQYLVTMHDRGEGFVYRLSPSQFTSTTYNVPICALKIEMLDIADCQDPWCYNCKKLDDCELLRGQYERKRRDIQEERYKQDLEKSIQEERRRIPKEDYYEQAEELVKNNFDSITWTTKQGLKKLSAIKLEKALGCSATMAQKVRQYLKEEGYESDPSL